VESAVTKQSTRLPSRQRDGVPIKFEPRRYIPRPRIPGIVCPEREAATLSKRAQHDGDGAEPLGRRNMVQDAVAEREVELTGRNILGERHEAQIRIGLSRLLDGTRGDIDPEHVHRVQNLREQPRAGSDATPEVEHGCHGLVESIQTLLQIRDPPARKVFLALSGDGERGRERRVVVRGVSIEVGHGPGDFLAYSRWPSRVTTMSYRRASSSASAGK